MAFQTPGPFSCSSGTLSSIPDNAPNYLTFLEAEIGKIDKNHFAPATAIINYRPYLWLLRHRFPPTLPR